jgi:hypothetical protein
VQTWQVLDKGWDGDVMRFAAFVALAVSALPTATFSKTWYGSFLFDERVPAALFLTGEIRQGDSFELREALRDHEISIVIMGSAGGNLYEGLQMGSILRDKGISTFVPVGVNCESSCANMFFGGMNRKALGQLGVHQFYRVDSANGTVAAEAEATAQYTMADVIGVMNELSTPPFVYEKMLGTTEMYYFSDDEKLKLDINPTDPTFLELQNQTTNFISANPDVVLRPASAPSPVSEDARLPEAPAPAGTNPPPSSPEVPKVFESTDFFGDDLFPKGLRNVSLFECQSACQNDPNCAAWSYVHATQWCWPKAGVSNISYGVGISSGVVDWTRVDQSILDRPFLEVTAIDLPGNDLLPKGMPYTTLDECRSACQAADSCMAFTWVGKQNMCFPKFAVGQPTNFLGAISGVKQ